MLKMSVSVQGPNDEQVKLESESGPEPKNPRMMMSNLSFPVSGSKLPAEMTVLLQAWEVPLLVVEPDEQQMK